MDFRTCRICNVEKPVDDYHRSRDKRRTECKSCKKHIDAKRDRKVYDDGFFSVYYLSEHHYVGITNCIKRRMSEHNRKGKPVDCYEIVGEYKTAIEAHYVETILHLFGYNGFHYKG